MMFHGGGDDMFALFAEPFRNAAQNHVIGFSAAAGKKAGGTGSTGKGTGAQKGDGA